MEASGAGAPIAPQERERAIEELSARFANDELSLDELERRLERVYKVRTAGELDALFADLRAAAGARARVARAEPAPPSAASPAYRAAPVAPLAAGLAVKPERLVCVMSNTRRRGPWTAGARLEILGIMSETVIDLTQAVLPQHDMEIDVSAFMAAVKIIVPRGMPVVSRVSALMGSVNNRAESVSPLMRYPTLHVTGTAVMAEVKVIVRDRR